jgi:glycosyltransferase involved in cell wall biosynthesis
VQSGCEQPLVVVGDAPYAADYVNRVRAEASDDARVRLLGSVWDQDLLDELYANASSYIHGHSVGGTNPSLLRAMGHGTPVLAYDVEFNREVLGARGQFFRDAGQLAKLVSWAEDRPHEAHEVAERLKLRVRERFDWDEVASSYGRLCEELEQGGPNSRVASELFRSDSV